MQNSVKNANKSPNKPQNKAINISSKEHPTIREARHQTLHFQHLLKSRLKAHASHPNDDDSQSIAFSKSKVPLASLHLNIPVALSSSPYAFGVKRAKKLGLECIVIDAKRASSRASYDHALKKALEPYKIDLVLLAGFMRILGNEFISSFHVINIHPSLLPLFKGANAIKDSFNSKMLVGGVTLHWVNSELDGGEIIAQEAISIAPTLEQYEREIHNLEYKMYPMAIKRLLGDRSNFAPSF